MAPTSFQELKNRRLAATAPDERARFQKTYDATRLAEHSRMHQPDGPDADQGQRSQDGPHQ